MRFRTAATASAVLTGIFFVLPDLIKAVFLPSLEQVAGQGTTTIPGYKAELLEVAFFLFHIRWLLALPIAAIVALLFAIAGFTTVRARNRLSCR